MTLEMIKEIQRLNVGPDEVLVITVPRSTRDFEVGQLRDVFKAVGIERVIVVCADTPLNLTVIKEEKA